MNVSFKRLSMLLMFGLMISPTPTHAEDIEAQNVAIQKNIKILQVFLNQLKKLVVI